VKKSVNIVMTTILSIGLLTTAVTAKPQAIANTASLSYEASRPDEIQVATEIPSQPSESQTVSSLPQSSPTTTSTDTQASRPRSTTSQVSRGQSTSTPTKSVSSSNNSSKASAIVSTAKKYIGVKYVWGGTTPSGFDCSGYTQYVFAQQGISLPRISRDQYALGTSVSFENLRAGDLVFFSLDGDKVIDHVGIFIGDGQFINASSSKGVTIYPMSSYWKSHYIGAKRVI
jgi:cell wall-associated NlpC family hydrolase